MEIFAYLIIPLKMLMPVLLISHVMYQNVHVHNFEFTGDRRNLDLGWGV
jgi:hypothetical protein